MLRVAKIAIVLSAIVASTPAQRVPVQLRGRWIIARDLPTETITCWDEEQAKRLIGTEIDYTGHSFRWGKYVTYNPRVTVRELTAEQFHDEYSGGGANDSQVSFRQLGIRAAKVTMIHLDHPDANFMGATIEIPGDDFLVKSENTIIFSFSVCNVYFEAHRLREHKKSHP